MRYPVSSDAEWQAFEEMSWPEKISVRFREARRRRAARHVGLDGSLQLLSGEGRPLAPGEIALIVCERNGIGHLPLFLEHYRRLGIARFIVVDDKSTDGSREHLAEQSDVDVYGSAIDFTQSVRAARWRDELMNRYGRDRWYVIVDVDEFLLFPGSETRPLADFIADLERSGRKRALAPMLDTYPDGPLSTGRLQGASDIREVGALIDGTSYFADMLKYCLGVRGGPRHRLYGNLMRLTKFPVVFADRQTQFIGASIHGPFPHLRNYQAPTAVLMHLKFTASSTADFQEFVRHGQHFGASRFYREILEKEDFNDESDLRYDGSLRWENSLRLTEAGFMLDIRDGSATPSR